MRIQEVLFALLLCLALPCLAENAATVMFSSGGAQIIAPDGQVRPAGRGAELGEGETLETRAGRVQLRFRDGASMSLQPETRFRVDAFHFSAYGGTGDNAFFSLLKGGFRTLSGLIGKERREQYKVDAVVATIGIRGTDYSALLGEPGLDVATFGGVVEVCNDAGCALVKAGESVRVADRDTLPVPGGRRHVPEMGSVPAAPQIAAPRIIDLPAAPASPVGNMNTPPPTGGNNMQSAPTAGPYR